MTQYGDTLLVRLFMEIFYHYTWQSYYKDPRELLGGIFDEYFEVIFLISP